MRKSRKLARSRSSPEAFASPGASGVASTRRAFATVVKIFSTPFSTTSASPLPLPISVSEPVSVTVLDSACARAKGRARAGAAHSGGRGRSTSENAPNLGEGVEAPSIDAVTEFLQLAPCLGRGERLPPKGKRPALARSGGIYGTALVPKDAVAVRLQAQHRFPVFVFGEKAGTKPGHGEPEKFGDALDLLRADIDPPGLSPAAAVMALMARKSQPVGVPILRFHDGQSISDDPPRMTGGDGR